MEEYMIYSKKLVVAVKVDGKVLREDGDVVYVPFNSEYTLKIKNLESVKAVVSISIDGTNVTDNREVIVPPNSSVELEGFIKNDKVSNRFKFIERTQAISNHRGNRIDDGLIRVSYRFEKKVEMTPVQQIYWYTTYNSPHYFSNLNGDWTCCDTSRSVSNNTFAASSNSILSKCAGTAKSDVGVTTKGSASSQKFVTGSVNTLEETEHVLVLHLKGELKSKKVSSPLTVSTKLVCEMCGKVSKSSNKFCGRCGTALF